MTWHYRPDQNDEEDDVMSLLKVRHYTIYLKIPTEHRHHISEHYTTHYISRNNLGKLKPGDVLWIVNVHEQQLYLLGRLRIELLVDDEGIALQLIDEAPDASGEWFAIANKYEVEPMRLLNISHLVSDLRFVSDTSPVLDAIDGMVLSPQQLRPLRELTTESAELLADVWYQKSESIQDLLEITEDDNAYSEGKVVVRTVRERQRSRRLVNAAKLDFRAKHDGRLFCEVCGFDFDQFYGIDYIEAHHKEPIASLGNETANTVESVVMLCANCHRAAHTRTPPYSVDELREMINED